MRCKACNAQLKANEGRWNPVTKDHDDLCGKCKLTLKVDNDKLSGLEDTISVKASH